MGAILIRCDCRPCNHYRVLRLVAFIDCLMCLQQDSARLLWLMALLHLCGVLQSNDFEVVAVDGKYHTDWNDVEDHARCVDYADLGKVHLSTVQRGVKQDIEA